ncbi:grpIintron_endo, group I intron endonuclease [uncultured Caudovirales phage]|uniref:GrpIintron_endo, group I intron endonuclease n=1 Tax=uncultured Caudovirales phage TaxID=2100421 RepID=A0A6J5L161_9CAUD|nr:grpIintron_endo, group I intron endonuclease [uncultured Caudovirales phage]
MIVYKIVNNLNGKVYIGQTVNTIECRFSQHGRDDGYLSKSIKKHGKENFTIHVIARCTSREELNNRERFCIRIFNSLAPNGYNLNAGGGGSDVSKETSVKISIKQKQRWANKIGTEKSLAALLDKSRPHALLGKKMSIEYCKKLSDAHKGYVMPQSQKDAIAKGNKGKTHKDAASIKRIDIKTGEVKIYSSCKEVEKDGYNKIVVWRAAVGERRTAYKYKWKIVK